ncbi:PREDICTED: uncharacterized protein LOC105461638 [Wasmannia auropunctata]|uniref:uncharacterized protein LOC105461638 n=1 Tax=Wasmannia auropunctata TaxID=64793 RepID=UPI0005F02C99|nr:PREDICTED: uncharacterized protein LOC105461638 [Wasmannia auropunctata]
MSVQKERTHCKQHKFEYKIFFRSWLEAANNEKKTRSSPCCFIQPYELYKERNFFCHIKNIRIKPSAGLIFVPYILRDYIEREHIENLLPKHCKTIILYSDGIIMDEEHCESLNMVCAFLPQIPNVRVKSFQLPENCTISETIEYQEIISTIVNNETSTLNRETCLMLFSNQKGHKTAQRWASVIQESKENEIVSVWGGIMEDVHACDLCKEQKKFESPKTSDCVAILITGPIQTWSMVLNLETNTEDGIEAELILFKDKVKLKQHSIGFIFISRLRTLLLDFDEEEIFKRLFPTVPLVKCSSYAEYGKTTAEVNNKRNSKEKRNCKNPWYNEHSIVILILTYSF